jgi:hypothetical protein
VTEGVSGVVASRRDEPVEPIEPAEPVEPLEPAEPVEADPDEAVVEALTRLTTVRTGWADLSTPVESPGATRAKPAPSRRRSTVAVGW